MKNQVEESVAPALKRKTDDYKEDPLKKRKKPSKIREHSKENSIKEEGAKEAKIQCAKCKKKLRVSNNFVCRCGFIFCALHRFDDQHDCSYDFVKDGKEMLQKNNPKVYRGKMDRSW
ncbi:hypothetical protein EDEG_01606 [Edhazardia aedis USNM 41457]|uniref:AN1-type domain-containing protein n=1 Tax=Edhazardia aedis (strain USNM 41457) TaxID=1003232 RepID=J9D9C7_EDHAE|nr:hypothetical protein EDEG_01606 [Edhazardia aedis USNM 41457]|eukprot:EJW04084.1 hypothetical protein EDEG_01606 [Edhazardia aedis USNM 41457]